MSPRKSVLRKLRVYSNKVTEIAVLLDREEITETEAERKMIELDEYYADRILSISSSAEYDKL